ncbi:MAG: hypothetical protein IKS68_05065, partial [Mailhella sp.]|nr:hypothetical protein [Mailhella sp.]
MCSFLSRIVRALLFLPCLLAWAGAVLAADPAPFFFKTEWSRLSAVDGRELSPPLDKNVPMAVLWLIPGQGYHTYAHEPGAEGTPLRVQALAGNAPLPSSSVQTLYVPGTEKSDESGSKSYVHDGPTPVFLVFREGVDAAVTLDSSLLACSDRRCV